MKTYRQFLKELATSKTSNKKKAAEELVIMANRKYAGKSKREIDQLLFETEEGTALLENFFPNIKEEDYTKILSLAKTIILYVLVRHPKKSGIQRGQFTNIVDNNSISADKGKIEKAAARGIKGEEAAKKRSGRDLGFTWSAVKIEDAIKAGVVLISKQAGSGRG